MSKEVSLESLQDKYLKLPSTYGLYKNVSNAMRKTKLHYLGCQHEDGYWWLELESNVTITAEYLMLFHFLGIRDEGRDRKIVTHILKSQRPDGTWAIHWGGRGDLSATVEAYFALKLGGLSVDDPRLRKAREFILSQGGIEASRVFTKIFLALFGEFDWKSVPSMPVETIFLSHWFPFNIYNFSSWARATVVPLMIVLDIKPVRPLPERAGIQELYTGSRDKKIPLINRRAPHLSWESLFLFMDRIAKVIENSPLRIFRKKALRRIENWLLEHQEQTGDWAGIQPAMVNSIIALSTLGYAVSSDPVKKGIAALERFTTEKENELVLQPCISPVWDTALTSLALLYAGLESDHPAIEKSCRWLSGKQIFKRGDWSIKRPNLKPGGWAFEFENNWYPDIDDSAIVLMLLYRYKDTALVKPDNLERGLKWILGMQGKDGGWGSFDVDNNMTVLNRIPIGDLEAMIDPSTSDVTGRVLELLGRVADDLPEDSIRKAVNFLKREQEEEGCWWGRWGVNYIYGTWSALTGLRSIGEDMTEPYIKAAVRWIINHQNLDGGWGEICETYEDNGLRCYGKSTPSQTAWAIMALIAADEGKREELIRGVQYLIENQKADGTWEEEEFTGTGFPKYFMLRYHNYRNCFPLMALGKFISQFSDG